MEGGGLGPAELLHHLNPRRVHRCVRRRGAEEVRVRELIRQRRRHAGVGHLNQNTGFYTTAGVRNLQQILCCVGIGRQQVRVRELVRQRRRHAGVGHLENTSKSVSWSPQEVYTGVGNLQQAQTLRCVGAGRLGSGIKM